MAPPPARPSRTAPARRCAHGVLRRVFEQGAYADRALAGAAKDLDARDRALATRLSYGAVQRRGTTDHLIEALAERPLARLDGAVLASLRLGLYELLYLDGAPTRAVVADCVELAKAGGRGGHGLVNAILRRAGREGPERLLGGLDDETPANAAILHSHPQWLMELWFRTLGPERARALAAADNQPGEVALRANTLVADAVALAARLEVASRPDELIPEALVLEHGFDVQSSQAWQEGAFTAQARAAMLVSRVLMPKSGQRVLDLCAAPGGKTTHLSALMQAQGELVAVERRPARASELKEVAARMRATNVRVELGDAAHPRPETDLYDRVLVDPPCSGLGTLQARPDLRWRITPQAPGELVPLQRAILDAGAAAVRPGGLLVYSTCTISPTENQGLMADFLESRSDFVLDDLSAEMPELVLAGAADSTHAASELSARTLQTLPDRDRTSGFFIARLRRA